MSVQLFIFCPDGCRKYQPFPGRTASGGPITIVEPGFCPSNPIANLIRLAARLSEAEDAGRDGWKTDECS
jgi:hypothetical protein